ncbi:MAG: hypothetical protein JNM84_25005 [Planctomycetes bacterium]|nr:hypothetical protein [Planctomycetota bacterium]
MRCISLLASTFLVLASAAIVRGQSPLAYPQSTTTESVGNVVPFGVVRANRNFDESRYQLLIPATHLPTTPTMIAGLEVSSQVWTGTLIYSSLQITLSNTPAASLSSAFDANLLAPTLVYGAANIGIAFTARRWSPIPFSTPFLHNGTDALVIDLKKVINRASIPSVPGVLTVETAARRGDLPLAYGTFGPFGSGASTAATASLAYTEFLMVRLLVVDAPTVELQSDVSGTTGNTFALGATADVRLHSVSGSPFLVFAESTFIAPFVIPPIQGALLIPPLTVLFSGTTGANHAATLSMTIPHIDLLLGGRVTFQGIALQGGNLRFTNGADALINP